LLSDLSTKRYGLYAITNWSSSIYEVIKKYEFFENFEDILISSLIISFLPGKNFVG